MSRKIIDREIASWVQKSPLYEKYFSNPKIQGLLGLCDIVTSGNPLEENLTIDFIEGLALVPIPKMTRECDMLVRPVIDLIIEKVKSDEYRKLLIGQEISGEAILKLADIEMPITQKEILLHIKRTKENPLVPKDIARIERSLIDYKRNQYSTEHFKGKQNICNNNELSLYDSFTPLLIDNISKADYDSMLANIKNQENQFWKGLPMDVVVNHFKILTERNSKNGKTFLTLGQFISFLRRGFLNDTNQPKQKINCSTSEKGFVIKRFYEFFVLAAAQYSHPNRKEKFINLFTMCFDNWDESTVKPFFKNKTKEKW